MKEWTPRKKAREAGTISRCALDTHVGARGIAKVDQVSSLVIQILLRGITVNIPRITTCEVERTLRGMVHTEGNDLCLELMVTANDAFES